ncbi:MAG: plasmid mobilization relaxosome protein MobC, partial [Solirubrobacteraceae bacterium]
AKTEEQAKGLCYAYPMLETATAAAAGGDATLAGMTRGTGEPRRRTISLRVTDAEWALLDAARERSTEGTGRPAPREMGAWCRRVVLDVARVPAAARGGLRPTRAGDLPAVPQVNLDARADLARVGSNLNQIARALHVGGASDELVGAVEAAVPEVRAAARRVLGLDEPSGR